MALLRSILLASLMKGLVLGFMPIQPSASRTTTNLFSTAPPLPEGLLKTVSKVGTGPPVKRGDTATVKYSCYLPDSPPFARSDGQKVTIGGNDMIAGWEEAIATMRVGERAIVRISNPDMGYGADGVPPVVPPNAEIELDLEILDSKARSAIDFDTLAIGDPDTPRTAESIAAAYDSLMEKKSLVVEKEGIEGWIETAKGWYFFGFFEGETGEEAPWYLKPSITFPLAFLVVGAAFVVSFTFGAISERGVQSTDELDDLILTFSGNPAAALLMTALAGVVTITDVASGM